MRDQSTQTHAHGLMSMPYQIEEGKTNLQSEIKKKKITKHRTTLQIDASR